MTGDGGDGRIRFTIPRGAIMGVLGAVSGIFLLIVVLVVTSGDESNETPASEGVTATATATVTVTPAVTVTARPVISRVVATKTRTETETYTPTYDEYGDGTYVVGQDIKPGRYFTEGDEEGCYWARLSSLDSGDIIDNGNAGGPTTIQVRRGDEALQIRGSCTFGER